MADLRGACQKALESGKAEKVSDTAISFTGKADLGKLASVQHSYAQAFHKRLQARIEKEQEAEKDLHDFTITF